MIKYQVMWEVIEKVEIERETPSFVVFASGRKDRKNGDYRSYFDTEDEAVKHLINKAKSKVFFATDDLRKAGDRLKNAKEYLAKLCEKYDVETEK